MKKILLRPPDGWPQQACQLYREYEGELTRRISSAHAYLLRLAPFLRYQHSQGLSYREFPVSLWTGYADVLTPKNRLQCWAALCTWLKFLYRRHELLQPLHKELGSSPRHHSAPRRILSHQQILKLLELPDTNLADGLRDRAMLELAYATGLRSGEMFRLDLGDLDLVEGSVCLRWTKTKVDRVLPLGKWALHFLHRYLREARPQLTSPLSSTSLWLGKRGQRLLGTTFAGRVHDLAARVGFHFTLYSLRHACATHLLQQGAPLRDVQELLGHRKLGSTQNYTRITPTYLQQMHRRHHPRNQAYFSDKHRQKLV